MKTQLSTDDLMRLESARGLDLHIRDNRNSSGKLPSVETYNHAIKREIISGRPIVPIGTENPFSLKSLDQ